VSEKDMAVIREQYDATNRRDFSRAMELYADEVVLIVPPSIEGIQNPGTYRGKDAVGEWFGDWFRTMSRDYSFEIQEMRELEGGLILMSATHGGSGRRSGVPVQGENNYLYRVRDGEITEVGFFGSREDALQAASLPEWSESETD
jgi:ketosteroid isomerase-like protein